MVAPKGPVSNETWKKISWVFNKIKKICNKLGNNLRLATEESYKEPNMYNEVVAWRALLRQSMALQKNYPQKREKRPWGRGWREKI